MCADLMKYWKFFHSYIHFGTHLWMLVQTFSALSSFSKALYILACVAFVHVMASGWTTRSLVGSFRMRETVCDLYTDLYPSRTNKCPNHGWCWVPVVGIR